MDRTNGAGHVGHMFAAENVATLQPPTEITQEWLNAVQEEIVAVVLGSGQVLSALDSSQLWKAVRLAPAEIPVGVIDGLNSTFTLSSAPKSGLLSYFINGLFQIEGVDYTLSATIITTSSPLAIGDVHAVQAYRY